MGADFLGERSTHLNRGVRAQIGVSRSSRMFAVVRRGASRLATSLNRRYICARVAPSVDFFALADAMEVAFFLVQGTALRHVNPAAVRMTGYTREQLLAMRFWDILHPDDREIARERGLARQAGAEL